MTNTGNTTSNQRKIKKNSTGIFGKAVLKETLDILPRLPDTDSINEIREFLCANLHYSAEQTRQRNANYIIKRTFYYGYVDEAIRMFAKTYQNAPELKDVCFYRFLHSESLQLKIAEELLLPNIGKGIVFREQIRDSLIQHFPESKSIPDGTAAIIEAFRACDIVRVDRKSLSFSYRDIPNASFAFILHSEYPEPGIYNIEDLENNRYIKALLWNPDKILYALYELRNLGVISKVSEIDSVRQFTTKYTLNEAVRYFIDSANR